MNLEYVTNEAEVGLPPLQASRKAVWDYYRIEFLDSGYPGRRQGDVLYAHPIYGPYVISDYLAQFRATGDDTFRQAAFRVADAALEQMEHVGGGLAFIYDKSKTAVSSRSNTFYSGLTQARYLEAMRKLVMVAGGERFVEPLDEILTSLTVPVDKGGVARYTSGGGLIIEEYPSEVPDCTLNGWTTATCILRDFADTTGSEHGWEVFRSSVEGLEELMPLYDVPELANSRYRLTGFASLRLAATDGDIEVTSLATIMPDLGTYHIEVSGGKSSEAFKGGAVSLKEGDSVEFEIPLSRLTWPSPNRIEVGLRGKQESHLSIEIGDGEYSPMKKNLPVSFYRDLAVIEVAGGSKNVEIAVPWADAELIAYPTNFGKAIANQQFNQYHWIHVDTLGKISDETGSEVLGYFRDKWERYPERWGALPEYNDERITLERFNPRLHR